MRVCPTFAAYSALNVGHRFYRASNWKLPYAAFTAPADRTRNRFI
jgi:hypothetical protein